MIGKTTKVDLLMLAIAEHEGWFSIASGAHPAGSRAYRHHNPGNLRASPFADRVVEGFAVFRNDFVGFNALQWDLMQKARGQTSTGLNGKSTIRDLIKVWAPAEDNNNVEEYIEAVVKITGMKEETTLEEIFEI